MGWDIKQDIFTNHAKTRQQNDEKNHDLGQEAQQDDQQDRETSGDESEDADIWQLFVERKSSQSKVLGGQNARNVCELVELARYDLAYFGRWNTPVQNGLPEETR